MARPTKKQQKAKKISQAMSKMTKERLQKLEEAFALDCTIQEACLYAGIAERTYYYWVKQKPQLVQRFEALRNNPVLIARQTVIKALKDNPELALKYLERKRRAEFALRQEVTGEDGGEIKIKVNFDK